METPYGLGVVLRHAPAGVVHGAEVVLGQCMVLPGGLATPPDDTSALWSRRCSTTVLRYLLRGLVIERANQVWCADITYIPMARGFLYLVAAMDWFSRYVLAWRLSISLDADFCVEALEEALDRYGEPAIFNTD